MKRLIVATLIYFSLAAAQSAQAQESLKFTRTEDVVYGRRFGTALTLDVIEPEKKTGAAVFYVVSGGFYSDHESIKPERYKPLLDRGYTIFAIVHSSKPRYFIPEIEEDIHRAVRFVRHNASRWGVDPNKFGIAGGSSGGQLALTIGTQGGRGNLDAKDPIDRESSAVQAVACFYPPTDFLNWSKPGEDAVTYGSNAAHQFEPPIGPKELSHENQLEVERMISPINFVTSSMAPTLIIQGNADVFVPLYQAQIFEHKCKEMGAPLKLIIKPGIGHSYSGWEKDISIFADWFDQYLLGSRR